MDKKYRLIMRNLVLILLTFSINCKAQEINVMTINDTIVVVDNNLFVADVTPTPLQYLTDSMITGYSSNFNGTTTDWVTQLGTPTFDINSTVSGNLYIDFSTSNQSIKIDNPFPLDSSYYLEIRAKVQTGTNINLTVGQFASGERVDNAVLRLTTDYITFIQSFRSYSVNYIAIGVIAADNNGANIAVDYISVRKINSTYENNELREASYLASSFNTSDFLPGLTRTTKDLIKIATNGNSLMANSYGGNVPEGETERAPRLVQQNIAYRTYDTLSWNDPTWRRIDNVSWTRSTLGGGDDFTDFIGTGFIEPTSIISGYETNFAYTQESGAYCEYAIPDGFENVVVIYTTDDTYSGQVFDDSIYVTLNGGSIALYGDTILKTDRVLYTPASLGTPYNFAEYTSLPAGINTIRLTKQANLETFMIWGLGYWTGNSLLVQNIAHGGRRISELRDEYFNEIIDVDYDAILIQIPHFNELSDGRTLDQTQQDLERYINDLKSYGYTDLAFITSHPWGCNPMDECVTNYYANFDNPDLFDLDNRMKTILNIQGLPFMNSIEPFKTAIEAGSGTLEGGEGGYTYTTDGQHPNTAGAITWMNFIRDLFTGKIQ